MSATGPVLIAAGGTGGHLFPAEALAAALNARGVAVELATDSRAKLYGGDFPARAVHEIAAATPSAGSLAGRARAVLTLSYGTLTALILLFRRRPSAVVGFGGYPTVPPLLAAALLHVPTILHEQNAVIGRANRFLAGFVDVVATGFPRLKGLAAELEVKTAYTGNPVRPGVLAAARTSYPEGNPFRLLVIGGSQGARIMADIVPAAVGLLSAETRRDLCIAQQARGEDAARVKEAYAGLDVGAEVLPFFSDLPARMASANLVVARAGASTLAELAVIGRPAILVPFPHALDKDQAENAAQLGATGAAIVVDQADFTPQWLARTLTGLRADPAALRQRGVAARRGGVPDAAERLADLVLKLAA